MKPILKKTFCNNLSLLIAVVFLNLTFFAPQSQAQQIRPNASWSEYIASLSTVWNKLQEPCKPRRFYANPQVKFSGSVILSHGFSACPQQYFELAQRLSDQGLDVFLPLNPGHGIQYTADNQDDTSGFPTLDSWTVWEDFSQLLLKIARDAQDYSLNIGLGGISVGGTVALRAFSLHPYVFSSVILYAPQVKLQNFKVREVILPLAQVTPQIAESDYSWGEGCYIEERQKGRGGICNFKVKHLAAVQKFADFTMSQLKPLPEHAETHVQVLGVHDDIVVSNDELYKLVGFLDSRANKNGVVKSCLYPVGTNHSMLSRFDSPSQDKFWVEGLIQQSVAYYLSRTPFAIKQHNWGWFDDCQVGP